MKKLICFGDSITDCGRLWDDPPLGAGYVSILEKRLKETSSGPWSFLNCGVDGFTAARVLEQAQRFPAGRLSDPSADVWVSLLVGINDIYQMLHTNRTQKQQEEMMLQFRETYDRLLSLLETFLSGKGQLLIMEPFAFPVPESNLLWFPWLSQMSKMIRELSDLHHGRWIPLQNDLLKEAKSQGFGNITLDGVHLTKDGHRILAQKMYDLLI